MFENKMKVLISMLIIMIFIISGCSNSSNEDTSANDEGTKQTEDEQYIFATGPTGGAFYPLGGTISEMWNSNVEGVNVTSQATAAGLENLRLLKSEEAAFALLPESISYFGLNGTGIVEELDEEFENYSAIARIYPEAVQMFVNGNSDIESIKELSGQEISIGAPGGYQQVLAKQVFEIAGIKEEDFKPSYTGYAEAGDLYQDNMIDGAFFLTGVPNSTLTQLDNSNPFKFISIEKDIITQLQKELPFASSFTISKDEYSSLESDTDTFSIWATLLVRNDLPEDKVYELTKSLFENAETMGESNAQANSINADNVEDISLPLHPGAQKYYEDQGIDF